MFLQKPRRNATAVAGFITSALILASCGSADSESANNEGEATGQNELIDQDACDRNAEETITYISGFGYSPSAGQLDVFMAEELGYFDDLCLDVEINASGANGQQLVSSGRAQFTALGSAEDVLMAAENSENLTAVATYGTTSPFCIFANESITDLQDLEGGTLGYFINLTPVASAMVDAAGADMAQIEQIQMTNYDPTVVTRGQVDAIVGYASNQCETLRAMGEDFSEFVPADYDLGGTYNVMEVNSEFLADNRDVVSDFMRATLKALNHCLANEDDCIDRITALAAENDQGDAFPPEQQERTWRVESQWVRDSETGPPGVQSVEQWQEAADIVKEYGSVTDVPPVTDVIDTELLDDLYDSDDNFIWPDEGKPAAE